MGNQASLHLLTQQENYKYLGRAVEILTFPKRLWHGNIDRCGAAYTFTEYISTAMAVS